MGTGVGGGGGAGVEVAGTEVAWAAPFNVSGPAAVGADSGEDGPFVVQATAELAIRTTKTAAMTTLRPIRQAARYGCLLDLNDNLHLDRRIEGQTRNTDC